MDKHSIVHDSSCTLAGGDHRVASRLIRKTHHACKSNTEWKVGLRKQTIDVWGNTDERRWISILLSMVMHWHARWAILADAARRSGYLSPSNTLLLLSLLTISTLFVFVLIPQIFHKILEISQTVDIVRGNRASYDDVLYGFRTPKGHIFGIWKPQEHPKILGNTWSTFVELIVGQN